MTTARACQRPDVSMHWYCPGCHGRWSETGLVGVSLSSNHSGAGMNASLSHPISLHCAYGFPPPKVCNWRIIEPPTVPALKENETNAFLYLFVVRFLTLYSTSRSFCRFSNSNSWRPVGSIKHFVTIPFLIDNFRASRAVG